MRALRNLILEQTVYEDETNPDQSDEETSTVLQHSEQTDNVQTITKHGSTQLKNKERNL